MPMRPRTLQCRRREITFVGGFTTLPSPSWGLELGEAGAERSRALAEQATVCKN